MKKVIALALLLASCATTNGRPDRDPSTPEIQEKTKEEDLKPMTDLQIRAMFAMQGFFIDSNQCFTLYGICLGEKKLETKVCWAQHEQCVINVSGMYKLIFTRIKKLEEQEAARGK